MPYFLERARLIAAGSVPNALSVPAKAADHLYRLGAGYVSWGEASSVVKHPITELVAAGDLEASLRGDWRLH